MSILMPAVSTPAPWVVAIAPRALIIRQPVMHQVLYGALGTRGINTRHLLQGVHSLQQDRSGKFTNNTAYTKAKEHTSAITTVRLKYLSSHSSPR